MLLSMPLFPRSLRNAVHEGSTPLDVKPASESKPMWATWTKEPAVGPEILDLSILDFVDFDLEGEAVDAEGTFFLELLPSFRVVTFLNSVLASDSST